jgi:hypothetical protein
MNMTEIRELHAAARNATTGRGTGPRSEKGKLRSSLNAVRHGLAATHMLLPGEDRADYERRMDAIFVALDPKDEAQAQLVALVADDLWKLERLGKIEQGVTLGRIEELLGHTDSSEDAATTTKAIHALGNALTTLALAPIPTERDAEFYRRVRTISSALDLVASVVPDLPGELMQACEPHVTDLLLASKAETNVPMPAYVALYEAARQVMARLLERGDRVHAVQEDLRKAIATISIPDEQELRKLGRYRKLLQEGLQRRLAALDQLRKLSVATSERNEQEQATARAYRVRLRVVA